MNENKFFAFVWACVVVMVLGLIGAIAYSCDRTEDRRVECIKAGKTPVECRDAFKGGGQ